METRDICTAEKNEKTDKTYWYKIGTAFFKDDGKISIKLVAFPQSGQAQIFKRRERADNAPQNAQDELPW